MFFPENQLNLELLTRILVFMIFEREFGKNILKLDPAPKFAAHGNFTGTNLFLNAKRF